MIQLHVMAPIIVTGLTWMSSSLSRYSRLLSVSLGITVTFSWIASAAYGSIITEDPVSVIKLGGSIARFHCAGIGNYLEWEVDGLILTHESIINRGIAAITLPSSGTVQSNLTVPATSVNNGTTVRCGISISVFASLAVSNNATLTILPGIGQVRNLKFSPSFGSISWEPPPAAGILGSLFYHLVITNVNVDRVIVNVSTTGLNYPILSLVYCTHYNASVVAFSVDLTAKGGSVHTLYKTPGNNYRLKTVTSKVVINKFSDCRVSLMIDFFKLNGLPCPYQFVGAQTYPVSNISDIKNHSVVAIRDPNAVFVYDIYASFKRKRLYNANVTSGSNSGVIEALQITISTFDVQDCDVHTVNTSILVECTYAINSTASGFVLMQDQRRNIYVTSMMERRLESDALRGFVKLTSVPQGEYSMAVFDTVEDFKHNLPAFIFNGDMKIGVSTEMQKPTPSFAVPSHTDAESSFNTPTTTPVSTTVFLYGIMVLVFTFLASCSSILIVLAVVIIVGGLFKKKREYNVGQLEKARRCVPVL